MDMEEDKVTNPIEDLQWAILRIKESQEEAYRYMKSASEICENVEHVIANLTESREKVEENVEVDVKPHASKSGAVTNRQNLTETAKRYILSATGPLDSEIFESFLMDKVWGKPKSNVLAIARRYTNDTENLLIQLTELKEELERDHQNYMERHRLDVNLISRIKKLVKNIEEEREKEAGRMLHQTLMDNYVIM